MHARLVTPIGVRINLSVTQDDPRSRYHQPILLIPMHEEHPANVYCGDVRLRDAISESQDIIDGQTFVRLAALGCMIETDEPEAIRIALGLPTPHEAIVQPD